MATKEAPVHQNIKDAIVKADERCVVMMTLCVVFILICIQP